MLKVMTCLTIILTIGFGQYLAQNREDNIRLAPKLLNYQGYLTDTLNNPINDSLDILFRIYDAANAGNIKWNETQLEVPILKGIFHVLLGSVTPIPDSIFTKGTDRWLELRISSQNLAPRTRITASAYAYTADHADTADYARNVPADNKWVRSNGKIYTVNLTDTVGIRTSLPRYALDVNGVICGGVNDTVLAAYGAVLGGFHNIVGDAASDTGATVAGGIDNAALAKYATVGGGWNDTAGYQGTTVAGGVHNVANLNMYSTVGGGVGNVANGYSSTVGGGYYNKASYGISTISGGGDNYTGYEAATVGGGEADTARAWYSGVFSGYSNKAGAASYDSAAIVGGGFNNSATGNYSFVGGGKNNIASGDNSTVSGGYTNWAPNIYSTVSGGMQNTASGDYATVAGGGTNYASAVGATTSGGRQNTTSGEYSVIAGGYTNYIYADYAAILGGMYDTITATGNFSYLFGIRSRLTQDSTFMVDLPHIRFGTEAAGYEFPTADGSSGQALVTNGSGQIGWGNVGDNAWVRGTPDSVLFTIRQLGLVRAGNTTRGLDPYTYVDFGVECTTGTTGLQTTGITVSGGVRHYAPREYTTIAGGFYNNALARYTVIGGGDNNDATGDGAVVAGGHDNTASGYGSFVGGGGIIGLWPSGNTAGGNYSAVVGGTRNRGLADYAFIGAGNYDSVLAVYGSAISGLRNQAGDAAVDSFAVVVGGRDNEALNRYTFIGGGSDNQATDYGGTVAGGCQDSAGGAYSTVGGGWNNRTFNGYGVVGGGANNTAENYGAFVGGGWDNHAKGWNTVVCGGGMVNLTPSGNTADSMLSAVVGGGWNRALARFSFVGGGQYDSVVASFGAVMGGYSNVAGSVSTDTGATVAGGSDNTAYGRYSFIGGGQENSTSGAAAFVGGGYLNTATANRATVAGGYSNAATATYSTVGGGYNNSATGPYSMVGGGYGNTANDSYAMVPGGYNCDADSTFSFAAGRQAKSERTGCFTWGDATATNLVNATANRWLARCSGGVYFYTNSALTTGVYVAASGSAWGSLLDRGLLENIQNIDGAEVLDKLAAMPIKTWNFKNQDKSIRHIGPAAQDFAAFGVGDDDTHITTIDADGIAFAAIQELYKQNQELRREIEALKQELKNK
jgi:hypothetical protein